MGTVKILFVDGSTEKFDLRKFDFRIVHDGRILEVYDRENKYPLHVFPTGFIKKISVKNKR